MGLWHITQMDQQFLHTCELELSTWSVMGKVFQMLVGLYADKSRPLKNGGTSAWQGKLVTISVSRIWNKEKMQPTPLLCPSLLVRLPLLYT